MCCAGSYLGVTRPEDALHENDYASDRLAGFSAQGPVMDDSVLNGDNAGSNPADGQRRIKPDLVAPGAYLVGANSRGNTGGGNTGGGNTGGGRVRHCSLHGDRERAFNENNTLVSMGGTSVATAAVAGAAAIVRQYFQDG